MGLFDGINGLSDNNKFHKYDELNNADKIDGMQSADMFGNLSKGAQAEADYSTIGEAIGKPVATVAAFGDYITGNQDDANKRLQQALSFEQEHAGGGRGADMLADTIGGLGIMLATGGGGTIGQFTATGIGKMLVNQEAKRLTEKISKKTFLGNIGKALTGSEKTGMQKLGESIAKQDPGLETALKGGTLDSFTFLSQQPEAFQQTNENTGKQEFGLGANTAKALGMNKLFFTVPAVLGSGIKKGLNKYKINKRMQEIKDNGGFVKLNGLDEGELKKSINPDMVTVVNDLHSNEGPHELETLKNSGSEYLIYDNNGNFHINTKAIGDVSGKFKNGKIILDTNSGKINPLLTIAKSKSGPLVELAKDEDLKGNKTTGSIIGEMIDSGSEVKHMYDENGKISDWAKDFDAEAKVDLKSTNTETIKFDDLNKLNNTFDKIEKEYKKRNNGSLDGFDEAIRIKKNGNKYILKVDKDSININSVKNDIRNEAIKQEHKEENSIQDDNTIDDTSNDEAINGSTITDNNILLKDKLEGKNSDEVKSKIVEVSVNNLKKDLSQSELKLYNALDSGSELKKEDFGYSNYNDFNTAVSKAKTIKQAIDAYSKIEHNIDGGVKFNHITEKPLTAKAKKEYEKKHPHHILLDTGKKDKKTKIYEIQEPVLDDFAINIDKENIRSQDGENAIFTKEQSPDTGKSTVTKILNENEPRVKTKDGQIKPNKDGDLVKDEIIVKDKKTGEMVEGPIEDSNQVTTDTKELKEPLHMSLFKRMFYKVKDYKKSKKYKKDAFYTKYSPVSKKQLINNIESNLKALNGSEKYKGKILQLKEHIKALNDANEPKELIDKAKLELNEYEKTRTTLQEELDKLNNSKTGDKYYSDIVKQYIAYGNKSIIDGSREYMSLRSAMFDIAENGKVTKESLSSARKGLYKLSNDLSKKINELNRAKEYYNKKQKKMIQKLPDDVNAYIDRVIDILEAKKEYIDTILKSNENLEKYLTDKFLADVKNKERIQKLNEYKDTTDIEGNEAIQDEIAELYSELYYGSDLAKKIREEFNKLQEGKVPDIPLKDIVDNINIGTRNILDEISIDDVKRIKNEPNEWKWFKEASIIKLGKNAKEINPLTRPKVMQVESLVKEHKTLEGVRGVSIENIIAVETTLAKNGAKHIETLTHEALHYLNKFHKVDGYSELATAFKSIDGIRELIPDIHLIDDDEVIAHVLGKLFSKDIIERNNVFKGLREERKPTGGSSNIHIDNIATDGKIEYLKSELSYLKQNKLKIEKKIKHIDDIEKKIYKAYSYKNKIILEAKTYKNKNSGFTGGKKGAVTRKFNKMMLEADNIQKEIDKNKKIINDIKSELKDINTKIEQKENEIKKTEIEIKNKKNNSTNSKYEEYSIDKISEKVNDMDIELNDLANKVNKIRNSNIDFYSKTNELNSIFLKIKSISKEKEELIEALSKKVSEELTNSYSLKQLLSEEDYKTVKAFRRKMYDLINSSPELKGAYFDDIPKGLFDAGSEVGRKTISEKTVKVVRDKIGELAKEIDTMSLFDVFYYTQDRLAIERIASMKQGYENFVTQALTEQYNGYKNQIKKAVGDDLNEFDYHFGRAIQNGLHNIIDDLNEISYKEIKDKIKPNHNIGNIIVKKILDSGSESKISKADLADIIDKYIDNIAKEKFGSKLSNKMFSKLGDGTKRSSLSGKIPKNSLEIVQMMRKMFDDIDKANIDYVAMFDKEIARRRMNEFIKNNQKSFIKTHFDMLNKHIDTVRSMSKDWIQHEDTLTRHGAYGNQFGVNPELKLQNFDYKIKLVAKVSKGQKVIKKYPPTKKGTNGMYMVIEENPDLRVAGQDSVFAGFTPQNHDKGIYTAYLESGSVKKLKNGKYAVKTYSKGKDKWVTIDTKEIAVQYDKRKGKYKVFAKVPMDELEKSQIFGSHDNIISTKASDMYKKNQYVIINQQSVKHWRREQIKIALDNGVLIRPDEYHSLDPDLKDLYYEHNIKDFGTFYAKKRYRHHISGTMDNDLRRFTKVFGKRQKWINANIVRPLLGTVETLRGLVLTYNLGSYINSAASSYATYFINASKPNMIKAHKATAERILDKYKVTMKRIAIEAMEKNVPIQELIKREKLDDDIMHYAMTNGIGQTIRQATYETGLYKENRLLKTLRPMFKDKKMYDGIKNWWATPDSKIGNAFGNIFDKTELIPKLALYVDGIEAGLTKEASLQRVINTFPNYGMNLHPALKHLDLISPYTKYTMQFPKLFLASAKNSPIRLYGTLAMYHAAIYGSYQLNNGLDENGEIKSNDKWFLHNDFLKLGSDTYYYTGSLLPYIPPISSEELTRISILGSVDKLFFPMDINPFTFTDK